MRLDLDRGSYISIKKCAQGVSLYSAHGSDYDDCTIQTLTRKQVVELIAMLLVNTCPAPSYEEIDEALVEVVSRHGVLITNTPTTIEDDFMEDHGDNL